MHLFKKDFMVLFVRGLLYPRKIDGDVFDKENWLLFTVHGITMFYHRIIQVSPQIFR